MDFFHKRTELRALCCENVVCGISSVKHNVETKRHKKNIKVKADKAELIKRVVAHYRKQSNVFTTLCAAKNQATEGSYKVTGSYSPMESI